MNGSVRFNYIIGVDHFKKWIEAAWTTEVTCRDNGFLKVCDSSKPNKKQIFSLTSKKKLFSFFLFNKKVAW